MCDTAVWILMVLICFSAIAYWARNNMPLCPPCSPLQLLHRLRPAPPPTSFQVKESDSVDERLDRLAEALADKEKGCYLSKFKIKSTKHEMGKAGDGPKTQYRSVLSALRKELDGAEAECRRIQEQIEWLASRRAELSDEIQLGHRLYGRAATELASNLADLQKGRPLCRPLPQPPCHQGPPCSSPPPEPAPACRCRKEA